ncbi:tetratricopeptide repeat protein [Pseudomonas sp. C27(2019)]|uniref:tetratricopeptide repeat protein n=1 Tax=Pseudomonas sp. C27(2019) TaxID=2604941 RepID=UPI001244D2AF|nr:tetratricopeptide repeat protein [Pseudomonas sp. C27(2019)]QEY57960.1 tetratricopeptide repeat protein [Pseudomonas sp. C27(2019)]
MSKHAVILIALAALLAGCSGAQHRSIPVVESGGPLTPGAMRDSRVRQAGTQQQMQQGQTAHEQADAQGVQVYAVPSAPIGGIETHSPGSTAETPAAPVASMPIGNQTRLAADEQLSGPVLALLTTAKQQQTSGDFNGAASSLERAQRIAPREPQVLYRLAEVRLAQGNPSQAEQLAQRGLSYSNGRPALQAGLWELIARARAQQGDTAGAEEAQRRARVNL